MQHLPVYPPDIGFLRHTLGAGTLAHCVNEAQRLQVMACEVVISEGHMGEDAYYQALARHAGVAFWRVEDAARLGEISPVPDILQLARGPVVSFIEGGRRHYLTAPRGKAILAFLDHVAGEAMLNGNIGLTSPMTLRRICADRQGGAIMDAALRIPPVTASARGLRRLLLPALGVVALGIGLELALPQAVKLLLFMLTSFIFLLGMALRIEALEQGGREAMRRPPPMLPDARLPRYSVLVPLYREAHIVPQLFAALRALDYPAALLEVIVLVEADDPATADAVREADPLSRFMLLVVPDGAPRTKPRALQYGLQFATGPLLTIYDAEDVPEPMQLREAAAMLVAGGPQLGCVQAHLAIDNRDKTWLTRQFAAEYDALFAVFLPSLASNGWPILLGGTSNHFRLEALRRTGGWDAWNVTEDADLGLRLARHGYSVGTIASRTLEEAPATWRGWCGQRRRWMKGFIQTALVHLGQPVRAARAFGPWNAAGVCGTLLASLFAAFLYPVALLALVLGGALGLYAGPPEMSDLVMFGIGVAVFVGGHLLPVILLWRGGQATGQAVPALTLATAWIYWLLVSIAAYWAVWDLVRAPYQWLKTHHVGRG